jgi:hypothetical protein
MSFERTFKIWNEKTIRSIKDQLLKTNYSQIKSILQNHLDVLQTTLYSLTGNEKGIIDKDKPSRYKFLQAICTNGQIGKNVFIVESESEGEVVQLINYVIENNMNTSHVIVFNYFKSNWIKVRDTTISKVDLHSELQDNSYELNRLKGINESAVILSEFNSSNILSHYFIPFSIEKANIIRKILEL